MPSSALPNMGIKYPNTGDNDYNTTIQNSTIAVDAHDHTTGKGRLIETAAIADKAITPGKRSNLNIQVSGSSGSFETTSDTEIAVTNLSVSMTGLTTTRPVQVMIQSDLSGIRSMIRAVSTNGSLNPFGSSGGIRIYRGSTLLFETYLSSSIDDSSFIRHGCNLPLLSFIDSTPGGSSIVYSVKAFTFEYNKITIENMKLVAYEL